MLQWSDAKEARGKIALKAVEELNEIKNKKMMKANQDRIEAVKRHEKKSRLLEDAEIEVKMRKIILDREAEQRKLRVRGILEGRDSKMERHSPRGGQETAREPYSNLLLNPSQTEQRNEELAEVFALMKPKEGVLLIDFEELEDRERDEMRLLVGKYSNLFRYLFDRYTAVGTSLKRKGSLDLAGGTKLIKYSECTRCLRDHGMDSNQIGGKEISALMKMINDVQLNMNGAEMVQFNGFVQLVVQSSIHAHKKGRVRDITPQSAATMSYAQMVQSTLGQFRDQAQRRGDIVALYETPQAMINSGVIDAAQAKTFDQVNAKLA